MDNEKTLTNFEAAYGVKNKYVNTTGAHCRDLSSSIIRDNNEIAARRQKRNWVKTQQD